MFEVSEFVAEYAITQPLSFTLDRGESVALVGPNGSGKTTLLRGITGQRPIKAGNIRIAGTPIQDTKAERRAALVGFLPQREPTMAGFNVREAVSLGCYARRGLFAQRDPDDDSRIDAALRSVHIDHLRERDCGALSGGEYQRVRLARALAQNPQVLVLDEPLAHLDPGQSHLVAGLIQSLSNTQTQSCLVALHDLNIAALYFDRILLMNEGVIVADGPPSEIMTKDRLSLVYGCAFDIVTHPTKGRPQVLGHAGQLS